MSGRPAQETLREYLPLPVQPPCLAEFRRPPCFPQVYLLAVIGEEGCELLNMEADGVRFSQERALRFTETRLSVSCGRGGVAPFGAMLHIGVGLEY